MIIAREKKKNNIVEYILYMFQIEDIIRAHNFDIHQLNENIISKFNQPADILQEMKIWYADLIEKMHNEKIEKKGHLKFLRDLLSELEQLHQNLLSSTSELKYIEQYQWAKPNIEELRKKSNDETLGDIEICINGLYALLLLKLKKATISVETAEAMSTFSNLLSLLSYQYKKNNTI